MAQNVDVTATTTTATTTTATTASPAELLLDQITPKCFNPFPKLPLILKTFAEITGDAVLAKLKTNHVAVIENCVDASIYVRCNQRLYMVIVRNCKNCKFTMMDSALVVTRTCRFINCDNCTFVYEDVDVRNTECYDIKNSTFVMIDSQPVVLDCKVNWRHGCVNNKYQTGWITGMKSYAVLKTSPVPDVGDTKTVQYITSVDELGDISHIKEDTTGTTKVLLTADDVTKALKELAANPCKMTEAELDEAYDVERNEHQETDEQISAKAAQVAALLKGSHFPIIFTGAGVSTSAGVPDFRGPQGVWTMKEKGLNAKSSNEPTPTYAHYAITELCRKRVAKMVISTNEDGLHIRSGLPRHLIIEQHGNRYKERCIGCGYTHWRPFDVTTDLGWNSKSTGRDCSFCGKALLDTDVAFCTNMDDPDLALSLWYTKKCDLGLVLGTSMNVQPSSSFQTRSLKNGGKLVVVNLQKTPFDDVAHVRVFAKTDIFMGYLMKHLEMTEFNTETDKLVEDPPYVKPATSKRFWNF